MQWISWKGRLQPEETAKTSIRRLLLTGAGTLAIAALMGAVAWAQGTGTVTGTVTLADSGEPVHGVAVLVVGPGQVALTDDEGRFEIRNVPAGTYQVVAQREHLTAERQTITVEPETTTTADFEVELSRFHEDVTVTATPTRRTTTFEAFNATTTLDSYELVTAAQGNLGEALANEPGIATRSFGPGPSRPIIRGFDGDRVLVMEDGIRTADLSSQSGDHGVTIDPNSLERVEIVRGPATLLYGSNAVGGVVNAITPQESYRDSPFQGTRGQLTTDGGSANEQAGINANVQHAPGNVMFWAGGGSRRTADYDTPEGTIENSATRLSNARAGIGYFGNRFFASGGFTMEDSRYGIPFAGEFHGHHDEEGEAHGAEEEEHAEGEEHEEEVFVDLDGERRVGRFDLGVRNLNNRVIDSAQFAFNVIDWHHDEIEIEEGIESIGTMFDNRTYVLRADVHQRPMNVLSGRFGVWSQFRDYSVVGAEALAPPTEQTAFAAFAHEELSFGRYRIQFGGRVERNDYSVGERAEAGHEEEEHLENEEGHEEEAEGEHGHDDLEAPAVRDRDFTGVSGSIGFRAELGRGSAFVANLTRSHRAPALEELYNFGPHVGNLTFEIGNPDLESEATVGLDLSVRHQSDHLRGDFNFYVYDISNFVFLDIEDEIVDNLRVADVLQGDSRFVGFDAKGSVRLGGRVWAHAGLGFVDAELTTTNEPLPRIPPLRGQVSLDIPYRGLTVTPEWVFAAEQDQVFRDETVTDGCSVLNLRASYVWPTQHATHIVSVTAYNLTDELYRNHTSFIKDLAPEMGRGVKVGYSLRFF